MDLVSETRFYVIPIVWDDGLFDLAPRCTTFAHDPNSAALHVLGQSLSEHGRIDQLRAIVQWISPYPFKGHSLYLYEG